MWTFPSYVYCKNILQCGYCLNRHFPPPLCKFHKSGNCEQSIDIIFSLAEEKNVNTVPVPLSKTDQYICWDNSYIHIYIKWKSEYSKNTLFDISKYRYEISNGHIIINNCSTFYLTVVIYFLLSKELEVWRSYDNFC